MSAPSIPRPLWLLAALLAVASLAVPVPLARAQAPTDPDAPLVWAAPFTVDSHPLDAIDCPATTLCVAVDHDGGIVTSTDPVAGGRAWRRDDVDANNFLTAIACPSTTECVATDNTGAIVSSADVPAGFATWTVAPDADPSTTQFQSDNAGPTLMRGIACPTTAECIAVDAAGNDIFSTNPTGGASAWTLAHIDTDSTSGCTGGGIACQPPIMGIACPSVSLCAAVDFSGNLLESATPTGTSPWGSESVDGAGFHSLWNISCPTSTLCASADGVDDHVITWNPGDPAALAHHRLGNAIFDVWCATGTLCLGAGPTSHGTDELSGSLNPAAPAATWRNMALGGVNSVSCPTPTTCIAADDQGDIDLGVTAASLRSALGSALLSQHSLPKIPTLVRRGGETLRFTSPLPGQLTLTWTVPGTRTPGETAVAPIVVASATVGYLAPARHKLRLSLTTAGRRLLKAAHTRFNFEATAMFSTSTSPVSVQRRLTAYAPRRRRRGR